MKAWALAATFLIAAATAATARADQDYSAERAASAQSLFATHCASCHGAEGEGSSLAPSLIGKPAALVHFMLDTGRMPAEVPYVQQTHVPPKFSEQQIDALVRYVGSLSMSSDRTLPQVSGGSASRGHDLFAENCQQCHGVGGNGGAVGYGYNKVAPPLSGASVFQVAEAIRSGPGVMPRFGPTVLSDADVDDIARYVNWLQTQDSNPGGIALSNVGPVAEGFVAWFFGLGLLVAVARRLSK